MMMMMVVVVVVVVMSILVSGVSAIIFHNFRVPSAIKV
jgi:hypothetical protein